MAGGFGRSSFTLQERTTLAAQHAERSAGAVITDVVQPHCPVRHCWVSSPPDGGAPRPGLLIEWRRSQNGEWEGRVVYAAMLRADRWATVEEWLPASQLSKPDPRA